MKLLAWIYHHSFNYLSAEDPSLDALKQQMEAFGEEWVLVYEVDAEAWDQCAY